MFRSALCLFCLCPLVNSSFSTTIHRYASYHHLPYRKVQELQRRRSFESIVTHVMIALHLCCCLFLGLCDCQIRGWLRCMACGAAGIVVHQAAIYRLTTDSELVTLLGACVSPMHYVKLYHRAVRRLGTSTEGAVVAVDPNRNIVIDGIFLTPPLSSDFYYAFEAGLPCLLKLSKQAEGMRMLQQEAEVYAKVKRGAPHNGQQFLVPVELIQLTEPCSARASVRTITALKMQIFVRTVQDCPSDPRLTELYLRVGIQVLSAIRALHAVGSVHCDIKPGNIFVTSDGTALLSGYDAVTEIGQIVERSTPRYLLEGFAVPFSSKQLRASPALDYAMLTYTLLECLGKQLTPLMLVERILDQATLEVQEFQCRGGIYSSATVAIENAKQQILNLLRQLHRNARTNQPSHGS